MPIIEIGNRRIRVSEDFLKLTPEEQNATVDEMVGEIVKTEGPSALASFGRGAIQGAAFNFADEAYGLGSQIADVQKRLRADPDHAKAQLDAFRSGDFSKVRERDRALLDETIATREAATKEYRANDAAAMEANPGSFIAGNIAGGLATIPVTGGASVTANLAKGAPLVSRMGAAAADGAIYGTAYGVGGGEDAASRLTGGATGALTGAVIGGAIPAVTSTVRAVGKPMVDAVKARLRPEQYAAQKTAERLAKDGTDLAQVEARLASRPGMSVVDVAGENARDLLRTTVNVPGPAQNRVAAQLRMRQMGQGDRIKSALSKTFADPDGYLSAKDEIAAEAKKVAGPLYDRAYRQPVPFSFEIEEILKTPAGKQALRKATEIARNEQRPFMQWFANVADDGSVSIKRVPDMRAWDYIKRGLDDVIEGQTDALTGKVTTSGRAVVGLKNRLLDILDRENPAYAQARKAAAEGFRLDDALEFGKKASSMSAEAVRRKFKDFSEAEKQVARIGYAEALRAKIDAAGWTHNKLLKVMASPEQYRALRAMFPTQEAFKGFRRTLMNEARKQKTFDAVRGNSTTARQLIDAQEAGQLGETFNTAQSVATGNITGIVQAISRGFARMGGLTPEVADGIAKRLMETNPAKARAVMQELQAIQNSALSSAQRSARIQSIIGQLTTQQTQSPVLQRNF